MVVDLEKFAASHGLQLLKEEKVKGHGTCFVDGDFRTLPIFFSSALITKTIPALSMASGGVTILPVYPQFREYPFALTPEHLYQASVDAEYAKEAVKSWNAHFLNVGYGHQFYIDEGSKRTIALSNHTQLVSAILTHRLRMSDELLHQSYDWLVQFKILQDRYHTSKNKAKEKTYEFYCKELEKLIKPEDKHHLASQLIHRAVENIEVQSHSWATQPLIPGARKPETEKPKSLKLFYSYAHTDEALRNELKKHLSVLKRQGLISEWHDRKITAGKDWEGEIDKNLKDSQMVLLLISPDFMDSDYCHDVELKEAMRMHESGEARVVPIFLRSCLWKGSLFGKLQGFPKDAKFVTSWSNQDEAFTDIATNLREAILEMTATAE